MVDQTYFAGPVAPRLEKLRAEMRSRGLQGFLIPKRNRYGVMEFLPPQDERLAWMTGFTGSAGLGIVLPGGAAVLSDSRYSEQMKVQLTPGLVQGIDTFGCAADIVCARSWLAGNVNSGYVIGYDPWLHPADEIAAFAGIFDDLGCQLQPVTDNPVDAIWCERPAWQPPHIVAHRQKYAGRSRRSKLNELLQAIVRDGSYNALLITDLASIAWLLNIRGDGDVPYAPLPQCSCIVESDGRIRLYVEGGKLKVRLPVTVRPLSDLPGDLQDLGRAQAKVALDRTSAPIFMVDCLSGSGATLVESPSHLLLAKSCKNAGEVAGARSAHLRDGAALTTAIARLKLAHAAGLQGSAAAFTELGVADLLLTLRRQSALYKSLSFPTIAAADEHGAIVHYQPSAESNRTIANSILIDSGAQYLDGTTDVTRTLLLGESDPSFTAAYTRVLKGLIALSSCVFPSGTRGFQLDVLSRQFLWEAGLDFGHGTGHGVGSYLSVHEFPPRISYGLSIGSKAVLQPGMIHSNEPGYYAAGKFGIRLENLQVVQPVQIAGAEKVMLGFEILTLAPFDRDAIAASLLTAREADWLNAYHERVRRELTPLVDETTARWLQEATAPIAAGAPA